MLSICIPIYNQNVTRLVNDLHSQAESLDISYEILLIDDCSQLDRIRIANRELGKLSNVRYEELPENIGRSAIRNLLAKKALNNFLIVMDCDASVCRNDYVKNYLDISSPGIVCYGGRKYPTSIADPKKKLRWLYGIKRESHPAILRKEHPNQSFITFNFLIDKSIFEQVKFDERIRDYGHEDTLFGLELFKKGIIVKHVDNELLTDDIEDSETFLEKTKDGINNLFRILTHISDKEQFLDSTKLLRVYRNIQNLRLGSFISFVYRRCEKVIRRNLLSDTPSLLLFDFYKLGYLCQISRK